MDINITINGDVNLLLPAEDVELLTAEDVDDGQPAEGWQASLARSLEHLFAAEKSETEDFEEQIVLVLTPGKPQQIVTCREACGMMPGFYEMYEGIENFAGCGLTLYARKDHILNLGEDRFLIGSAVVCFEDEDNDLWSLTGADIYHAQDYVAENLVMLSADGKELPAIRLQG